jgi:hypothetical protein
MRLEPGFRDITPRELVDFLIEESGQAESETIDYTPILAKLGLTHRMLDFNDAFQGIIPPGHGHPRALLSLPERIVVTHRELLPVQLRFSILHEIGHWVLPEHVENIILCTDRDLSATTRIMREKEANNFAADLLFHGNRFLLEANNLPVTARTIKQLAEKYQASLEATARRLIEVNFRPCMLIVYKQITTEGTPHWVVRNTIPSSSFKQYFFTSMADTDNPMVAMIVATGRDILDSLHEEQSIELRNGNRVAFELEYFYNQFNPFAIIQPVAKSPAV